MYSKKGGRPEADAPSSDATNRREHRAAKRNNEDPSPARWPNGDRASQGPSPNSYGASPGSVPNSHGARLDLLPNSHGAMHGRKRNPEVRKRNEHFQCVRRCAREMAECSLRSALRHPISRQERKPTELLPPPKRETIFWTSLYSFDCTPQKTQPAGRRLLIVGF